MQGVEGESKKSSKRRKEVEGDRPMLTIRVPVSDDIKRSPENVSFRILNPKQQENLAKIFAGLNQAGARLAPTHRYPEGQFVKDPMDAVRWLLENVE